MKVLLQRSLVALESSHLQIALEEIRLVKKKKHLVNDVPVCSEKRKHRRVVLVG